MDRNPNFLNGQNNIIEENKQEMILPQSEFEEEFSLEDLPEDDFLGIFPVNIQN